MSRNPFFGNVAGFFEDIGRARRASNLYQQLSHLSDEGLKSLGVTRGELPGYVFKKTFDE